MKKISKYYNFYRLAIKYYLQGDSWEQAKIFASYIVNNWRN